MRRRNRKGLTVIAVLLVAVIAFLLVTCYIERSNPVSTAGVDGIDTIVIDPGHGGLPNTID